MINKDCPYCIITHPVLENDLSYARYDKYPVSDGHILIHPRRHVSDFFDLTHQEKLALLDLLEQAKAFLDNKKSPDGYNIGINNGEAAGQTVMHAHIHLIPRYKGDMSDPRGGVRGVIPDKQKY